MLPDLPILLYLSVQQNVLLHNLNNSLCHNMSFFKHKKLSIIKKAVNAKRKLHKLCQFNLTGQKDHELTKTDFVYAP